MPVALNIVVLLSLIVFVHTKTNLDLVQNTKASEIDGLIKDLQQIVWDDDETPCFDRVLLLFNGVKNSTLWASWIWDSNQYPVGVLYGNSHVLGNYDQCLRPPWLATHPHLRTQYCTADVTITDSKPTKIETSWDPYNSTESYINTATKHGIKFNRLHWGVCMPELCHPRSISKILGVFYSRSQFSLVSAEPNITVDICHSSGAEYEYPTGYYVFRNMMLTLIAVTLASTFHQSIIKDKNESGALGSISNIFCLRKNYNSLVKASKDEVQVMYGIRFLSATFVVMTHTVFLFARMPMINYYRLDEEFEFGLVRLFLHVDVLVDTFLAMSGILHIKRLMARERSLTYMFTALLKRYLRFLGPLAVSIFYLTSVAEHISTGPIWSKQCIGERNICSENWKLTLLMLNSDLKNSCFLVTWYISCDYQLTVLGTLLFYLYHKNKRLGVTVFAIVSILSLIIPGLLTYWHQLPALPFNDVQDCVDPGNTVGLEYNYSRSYVRASTYLVGVTTGYLISIYKPEENRKTITKKWSIFGTYISIFVMLFVICLGKYFHIIQYNAIEVAITVALNRVIWAVAMCGVVVFCEYGTVPIVSDILSLPAFVPLSRLSYGIYLLHPLIILRYYSTTRTSMQFDIFTCVTNALGIVAMSVIASFVIWLLVEAPCMNITNKLFSESQKNKEIKKNGVLVNQIDAKDSDVSGVVTNGKSKLL